MQPIGFIEVQSYQPCSSMIVSATLAGALQHLEMALSQMKRLGIKDFYGEENQSDHAKAAESNSAISDGSVHNFGAAVWDGSANPGELGNTGQVGPVEEPAETFAGTAVAAIELAETGKNHLFRSQLVRVPEDAFVLHSEVLHYVMQPARQVQADVALKPSHFVHLGTASWNDGHPSFLWPVASNLCRGRYTCSKAQYSSRSYRTLQGGGRDGDARGALAQPSGRC